jgi:hypothetical protein
MKQVTGVQRTTIAPKAGPQVDALFVEGKNPSSDSTFGVLKRKIDGDTKEYFIPCNAVIPKAAAFTVTPEENGSTYYITSTGVVGTLPSAVKGLQYTFIIGEASNTHALSPQAADGIAAKGLTAVVDKDLVNSTSAIYDSVVLRAVDDNLWHAVVSGTWTKEA